MALNQLYPFPKPIYLIHLQLFWLFCYLQTWISISLINFDLASQALPITSPYLYCQMSWKTNLCPWYPLFTHHIFSLYISINRFPSQLHDWHHFWRPPETSFVLGLKVPVLNSHHFSNINHYNTCFQLLSSHLPPHNQTKMHPSTYILLIPFSILLFNSLLFLFFLSFNKTACQFSIYLLLPPWTAPQTPMLNL